MANLDYPTNRKILNGFNKDRFSKEENVYEYDCQTKDCKDDAVDMYIRVNTTRSHPFHVVSIIIY